MIDHLTKRRVRKIPASLTKSGVSQARLVAPVPNDDSVLAEYHLDRIGKNGDRIVPKPIGIASRRNSEGRILVHRNLPKEPHSWFVLWGREQFCGRGETEWVEDFVLRTGKRYPRTQLPAENIELIRTSNSEGESFFITDLIPVSNEERWRIAINLYLEVFGTCWIADREDFDFVLSLSRRVSWRLLPPGKRPWAQLKPELDSVIKTMPNCVHRNHAERSLQTIVNFGPQQTIVGEGGFHGYVAFHFAEQGFTVLESIHPNNATYILGEDWETISRLSKAEILDEKLHLKRVIHSRRWNNDLEKWFSDRAA